MLNLVVKPSARAQFDALPEVAALAVANVLRLLQHHPYVGLELLDENGDVFFRKLVIVRRRHRTLHIIYRLEGENLLVEYIDPAWVRRTAL